MSEAQAAPLNANDEELARTTASACAAYFLSAGPEHREMAATMLGPISRLITKLRADLAPRAVWDAAIAIVDSYGDSLANPHDNVIAALKEARDAAAAVPSMADAIKVVEAYRDSEQAKAREELQRNLDNPHRIDVIVHTIRAVAGDEIIAALKEVK